jgi:hypothetical protein
MQPHEYADDLTSEQRCQRLTALLALGLRRLLLPSASSVRPKNLPELSTNGLELRSEMRLSGQAG